MAAAQFAGDDAGVPELLAEPRVRVPVTLQFPRDIERRFLRDYYRRTIVPMRLSALGGFFIWNAFGILDYFLLPETYPEAWFVRFGIATPAYSLLIGLLFVHRLRRFSQVCPSLAMAVCGCSIVWMIANSETSEPGRHLYFAGIILVYIGGYVFLSLRFTAATVGSLFILAFYEVASVGWAGAFDNHADKLQFLAGNFFLVGANILGVASCYRLEFLARRDFALRLTVEAEQEQSEALLLNILPREIATRLKTRRGTTAALYPEASVMFADVVSFTPMTAEMAPDDLIDLLNEVFSYFDSLVEKHGVEKIKTIGDCYMAAAGVPVYRQDHAHALARMALEIADYVRTHEFRGRKLGFRIGINSGPVIAGVIGQKKFSYDLWGDAVNMASRMESHGREGMIQMTCPTYELLKDEFLCIPVGPVPLKGMGEVDVWYLLSEKVRADIEDLAMPAPSP